RVSPLLCGRDPVHVNWSAMNFLRQSSARGHAKTQVTAAALSCRLRQNIVTIDQVVREIVPEKKSRGTDPAFASIPSFHTRRREKNLSHLAHGVLRNLRSRQFASQHFAGLNDKLHWALDLRLHHPLG